MISKRKKKQYKVCFLVVDWLWIYSLFFILNYFVCLFIMFSSQTIIIIKISWSLMCHTVLFLRRPVGGGKSTTSILTFDTMRTKSCREVRRDSLLSPGGAERP